MITVVPSVAATILLSLSLSLSLSLVRACVSQLAPPKPSAADRGTRLALLYYHPLAGAPFLCSKIYTSRTTPVPPLPPPVCAPICCLWTCQYLHTSQYPSTTARVTSKKRRKKVPNASAKLRYALVNPPSHNRLCQHPHPLAGARAL